MVTVSSAIPSSPNLFPLVTCEGFLSDESLVAMGCLAKDFLPVPVTFSWTYKNSSTIGHQAIKDFPPVLREGKYAASSQLFLPSSDILQGTDEFVKCSVKHSNGNKDLNVPLPGSGEPLPPKVTIFIPPRDAFSHTNPRTSRLICQATGFKPKKISLSWLREGKLLQSGFTTGEAEVEQGTKPVTYSINSMLTITESDWLSQHTYTCQVQHNGATFEKNVSSLCNPGPSTNVQIFTIPPSFADIFLTKMAKLTCMVTNLATYDSLSISWTRQNGELLKTHSNISESHPNATFSAMGVTSVCVEDWEKGEKFTCTVTHTDLPSPLKQTISRPKEVAKHMPSVYVLPPTREQLSLRESASVTCLVKGFSPADVLVQWMQRGQLMSPDMYVTSAPMPEPQAPGMYFVYSILTVNEEDWSAGETYTCVVGHEALPHLVTERTVDKSTEGEVSAEEESFENLNTMASTFIVLFLLSLFYSTTVTLFKVSRASEVTRPPPLDRSLDTKEAEPSRAPRGRSLGPRGSTSPRVFLAPPSTSSAKKRLLWTRLDTPTRVILIPTSVWERQGPSAQVWGALVKDGSHVRGFQAWSPQNVAQVELGSGPPTWSAGPTARDTGAGPTVIAAVPGKLSYFEVLSPAPRSGRAVCNGRAVCGRDPGADCDRGAVWTGVRSLSVGLALRGDCPTTELVQDVGPSTMACLVMYPLVSGCKAPKQGNDVMLACKVTGSNRVDWSSGVREDPMYPSVLIWKEQSFIYFSIRVVSWKPGPISCSSDEETKTFQWPASWDTQTPFTTQMQALPKDPTPAPTTNTDPAPTPDRTQREAEKQGSPVDNFPRPQSSPHTLSATSPAITTTLKDAKSPKASSSLNTTRLSPIAVKAPSSLALRALTTPGTAASAGAALWLLCEVSGFSPPELLLTWREDQRHVDWSRYTTAATVPQPGHITFSTWSVLRVPAAAGTQPATYTCEVRHTASGKLFNTSWSPEPGSELPKAATSEEGFTGQPAQAGPLAVYISFSATGSLTVHVPECGDLTIVPPDLPTVPCIPQSVDENCDNYSDLDDTGRLWPTFLALFLFTLLYSGFVTFIKHPPGSHDPAQGNDPESRHPHHRKAKLSSKPCATRGQGPTLSAPGQNAATHLAPQSPALTQAAPDAEATLLSPPSLRGAPVAVTGLPALGPSPRASFSTLPACSMTHSCSCPLFPGKHRARCGSLTAPRGGGTQPAGRKEPTGRRRSANVQERASIGDASRSSPLSACLPHPFPSASTDGPTAASSTSLLPDIYSLCHLSQ
ncbi:uncharacterized protein V5649_013616 [Rhynchonycteris naso]